MYTVIGLHEPVSIRTPLCTAPKHWYEQLISFTPFFIQTFPLAFKRLCKMLCSECSQIKIALPTESSTDTYEEAFRTYASLAPVIQGIKANCSFCKRVQATLCTPTEDDDPQEQVRRDRERLASLFRDEVDLMLSITCVYECNGRRFTKLYLDLHIDSDAWEDSNFAEGRTYLGYLYTSRGIILHTCHPNNDWLWP